MYLRSLWDWDSFWTLTGLLGIAERTGNPGLKQEALQYDAGALRNFFDHQAGRMGNPFAVGRREDVLSLVCLMW